ncbi:hypothetical protein [Azospirillum sp. B510]|uniref:hypothetical protein n=1 Tax=Azospirillum sp. (strain B510) TaxID=137722 RepID=UPI0003117020|nr:hypothetical protein [Azospirillum sp. B510]
MAEYPQTPEAVALELLRHVAQAEKKATFYQNQGDTVFHSVDEAWILGAYKRCLEVVRGVPQGTDTKKLPVYDMDTGTWTTPE